MHENTISYTVNPPSLHHKTCSRSCTDMQSLITSHLQSCMYSGVAYHALPVCLLHYLLFEFCCTTMKVARFCVLLFGRPTAKIIWWHHWWPLRCFLSCLNEQRLDVRNPLSLLHPSRFEMDVGTTCWTYFLDTQYWNRTENANFQSIRMRSPFGIAVKCNLVDTVSSLQPAVQIMEILRKLHHVVVLSELFPTVCSDLSDSHRGVSIRRWKSDVYGMPRL